MVILEQQPAARRYDVLIVCAGTAGCAAAIHLPQAVSALLVDRAGPEAVRCCGGLIAHDAQAATRRLGLELPEGVRVQPEPRDVRVTDLDSGLTQTYRRDYWNLDRARFDSLLLGLACRRAKFSSRTSLVSLRAEPNGFVATLAQERWPAEVRCSFVIAADGANSRVRRMLLADVPAPPTAVALQATLPHADIRYHEVLFSSLLTDFYAWVVPKPDGLLVGSAFAAKRRARAMFEELLAAVMRTYALSGPVIGRCSRLLTRPARRAELCAGRGGVLLAGEAAGLVSPSSGEGISFALESGAAAGAALGSSRPLAAYERSFAPLAARVCRKFVKAKVIFNPRLRRLALRIPFYP